MIRTTRPLCLALALLLTPLACGGDDDSSGGGGDGGSGDIDADVPEGPTVAFRITDLDLLDPHVYAFIGACNDVTAVQNDNFERDINEDNEGPDDPDNPDGLLDLSGLAIFRPLNQAAETARLEVLLGADCTAPIESTSCSKGEASSIMATGNNDASAACDVILADTTTEGYDPAPAPAPAPCFAANAPEGVLEFGPFKLTEVAGAATYDGDPATGLMDGLLRGFISEEDADNTTVNLPILGDVPLSSLFPGGTDNCADGDDRDESSGTSGWYVYLSFTAVEVPFTE